MPRKYSMHLLITRPPEKSRRLKAGLQRLGFKVSCLALTKTVLPLDCGKKLKQCLARLEQYDALILTSPNAVAAVARVRRRLPQRLAVVVVGPATQAAARKRGWKTVAPRRSLGAAGLVSFFRKRKIAGQKIVYPRSQLAADDLEVALKKMGAKVDAMTAYRTLLRKKSLSKLKIDAAIFFSPSAVAAWVRGKGPKVLCIPFGSTTAKALRHAGLKPAFVPGQATESALVAQIRRHFHLP